jgi:3-hydroxybutyryl-CoA dehydrogenase
VSGEPRNESGDRSAPRSAGGPVFVVGAGTMAPGIAAAFAAAGYPVMLWGRSEDRAARAAAGAREMAGFLVEHGLAADRGSIEVAQRLEQAREADVVIEAISESLGAKQAMFVRLEDAASEDALLATNTSGLLVGEIGHGLRHRERLVAMHFWNPAHLMPLVEIAGDDAADSSIHRALELALAIGKVPVRLEREVLGFLGVRMQQAVVREAIALLERGVASAEDIDLAVRASFGVRFPVIGPLESADLSGLDVIASIHDYLLRDLDRSVEPQRTLRERVAAGEIGAKAGRGFFDWTARDPASAMRRRDEELVRRLKLLASEDQLRGSVTT